MQGLCKFGFYEVFKILYSNLLGEVSVGNFLESLAVCFLGDNLKAEFFSLIFFVILLVL